MRVEVAIRHGPIECDPEAIRALVRTVLKGEGKDAELSIALVGDEEMAGLNRRYLGREGVTDVLAFPYESDERSLSGEIIVNAELAEREAAGRSHGPDDELTLYVVHGLLHLLGYDDREAEAAARMRERERAILETAGRGVDF